MATDQSEDLEDIQNQLVALVEWIDTLQKRLTIDHACLALKQVQVAKARLAEAHQVISRPSSDECRTQPN